MPVEFVRRNSCIDIREQIVCDSTKLLMAYDGSGRRVSKTRMRKAEGGDWETELVTHYTGIGTEIREDNMNGTRVVVNLPQGLGRYGVEDAVDPFKGIDKDKLAGYIPSAKFEWYLKNHLGSTMLVYGTSAYDDSDFSKFQDGVQAAYDYRAFGEQVDLEQKGDKVTENFTGNEKDDEIELNYFGARYLDPMLGLWTSVDPARQFSSPYLYAGNGMNPVNVIDPDGEAPYQIAVFLTNSEKQKEEQDFRAVETKGRKAFGDNFEIKVINNQKEMTKFVKDGRYTAIIGHTWSGQKGKFYNNTRRPSNSLSLTKLDKVLQETSSLSSTREVLPSAKAFGCHTGEWGDDLGLQIVEYGDNLGELPMGEAYKKAWNYIVDGFKSDNNVPSDYIPED